MDRGEVFSMFFQVTAFFTAVKLRRLSETEAIRIIRGFLHTMFLEVRTVNLYKEICEHDTSFREEEPFNIQSYTDMFYANSPKNLDPAEKKIMSRNLTYRMMTFWTDDDDNDHHGLSLLFALAEYIKFEEELEKDSSEANRDKLFYEHLTRLTIFYKNPILWNKYFTEKDEEVIKTIGFLTKKIEETK
jgi:hypothetical protein